MKAIAVRFDDLPSKDKTYVEEQCCEATDFKPWYFEEAGYKLLPKGIARKIKVYKKNIGRNNDHRTVQLHEVSLDNEPELFTDCIILGPSKFVTEIGPYNDCGVIREDANLGVYIETTSYLLVKGAV